MAVGGVYPKPMGVIFSCFCISLFVCGRKTAQCIVAGSRCFRFGGCLQRRNSGKKEQNPGQKEQYGGFDTFHCLPSLAAEHEFHVNGLEKQDDLLDQTEE